MSVEIRFIPVNLPEVRDAIVHHLSNLSSPVESFFEDHVENSSHYSICINGVNAGHTSIHDGSLVTQFCLQDGFKRYGQRVFQRVKKMERVQRAFVPTCDEFFLSHALDEHRQLEKQAYFFQCDNDGNTVSSTATLTFRQAESADVELIQRVSGNFFDPVEEQVKQGELFITHQSGECVGIGVMIQSKFCSQNAAIGMFTAESSRNAGVGTATIQFLIQECNRQQKQPVAGCGYYNHLSKHTLEKAGMYSQTRLLKISY